MVQEVRTFLFLFFSVKYYTGVACPFGARVMPTRHANAVFWKASHGAVAGQLRSTHDTVTFVSRVLGTSWRLHTCA